MDFGDYIYVILAIVFSIASALGKKRKGKTTKPSKARDIFEQMFESSEVEDPIPQTSYVDEEVDFMSVEDEWEEEKPAYTIDTPNDMQEKLDSLYTYSDDKMEASPIVSKTELSTKSKKKHPIIKDLKNANEVRKAVLYAEILKPKF